MLVNQLKSKKVFVIINLHEIKYTSIYHIQGIDMKKTTKRYITVNLIMFTIFFLIFFYEKAQAAKYDYIPQYISVAWLLFLLIMILFLPAYGCITYYQSKKIIYPNLILFGFVTVFFVILLFYFEVFTITKTLINCLKICFVLPVLSAALSCLFSLITKYVLYLLSKNADTAKQQTKSDGEKQ